MDGQLFILITIWYRFRGLFSPGAWVWIYALMCAVKTLLMNYIPSPHTLRPQIASILVYVKLSGLPFMLNIKSGEEASWAPLFTSLCHLTVDALWPAISCPCCHTILTSKPWADVQPSSLKLLLVRHLEPARAQVTNVILYSKKVLSRVCRS